MTTDEKQSLKPRLSRMERIVADSSGSVEVIWAWYERRQGVVEWALRNVDSRPRSVILLRNSYYVGDGYWPIYSSNPSFRTSFIDAREEMRPLEERNVPLNTAPLGLVEFGDFQHSVPCLIFTLSPGQAWGMIEGGFGQSGPSSVFAIYDVVPLSSGEFCVGYDPATVRDWNEQTRIRMEAYTPNPSTFNTRLFQAENTAPYRKQFSGDSLAAGRCAAPAVHDTRVEHGVHHTEDTFPPVFPDVLLPPLNP
jgi:hypothetical protein